LPAALPLFATAIGAFGVIGRWRSRSRSRDKEAALG
jgi:hypothetical protein